MSPGIAQSHELVLRAASLIPMLRAQAEATEKKRLVSADILDTLADAGVFRMTAPVKYGGQEASFQTQCDVLAEVARGCPSTSWVATIYSAMTWLASVFSDEAQQEILEDRDPRISGVFSPTGTATQKDGGYVVSGRWPFNTGGFGSKWTVLVAVEPHANGEGLPICVIVRTAQLTRLDDWYASGMAGTGSSTVLADQVFVPAHRAQPLPALVEAEHPSRHNSANPYFGYPLAPVLVVNAGGTPLGIAQGAYENFLERLPNRPIAYTTYAQKSEAPVTHLVVGEAALKLESAQAHVRAACTRLDERSGRPLSKEDRVKSRVQIAYATGLAREVVDGLFFAAGASSIQSAILIQRFQRDMQALANHAVMHSQTAIELYGRVLCGLEPNTLLY
jgi:3-hydroxy-9,10-secoandrosta-1,3,5(10)-triene-9,17-dione monooxygenase